MTTTPDDEAECPGYSETMTRTPDTALKARRLARKALCAWDMDDAWDGAALLLTELVANAVRHASGERVRIIINRRDKDRVYVAVVDRDPRHLPELREAGAEEPGGRGLALVEEMADRWGYDLMGSGLRPWGKRVWAEMKVTR
ncbi:ATP-binding protein [Streptomyces sp. TRM68416]|uniref:ATP-binding protein n=1 Tax=Streptomyces sp. TRM68416 TaxID=2758412 RepID=UPI001661AA5B|nr:ATP-binding protein [Streptomyces sp. TRM68416]MBD0844269.1 ATP-binding protein [Streptomyces sp. TRM68416]